MPCSSACWREAPITIGRRATRPALCPTTGSSKPCTGAKKPSWWGRRFRQRPHTFLRNGQSDLFGGADTLVRGRRPRRPAHALQGADIVVPAAGRGLPTLCQRLFLVLFLNQEGRFFDI